VLKSIAVDYNATTSANPMFQRDALRLCQVSGFSTRDLCDKLAVCMLSQFGTRFCDLQRYFVRDFRLHTEPQQVRMISTKNGSQLYSWVKLPAYIAKLAKAYIQRAQLTGSDHVFAYAYREHDKLNELVGSLRYLERGRAAFTKTLDSMGRAAGYPPHYFTPHSGAHGRVSEHVIRACCQGHSIRDALDHVCAETGRWRIGSQAILRYIAPTVGRVMSFIPTSAPPAQRLAAFESMDLGVLHDVVLSTPYQRLSCMKWNDDQELIRLVASHILGTPIRSTDAIKDVCQRVATVIMQGLEKTPDARLTAFVEWCQHQAQLSGVSRKKSVDSQIRVWMARIIPTLMVADKLDSAVPGSATVSWPLPDDMVEYLELPSMSSRRQQGEAVQGERKTLPEVRGNENMLTRESLKSQDARGMLTAYIKKRKQVKQVVRIQGRDPNTNQLCEILRQPSAETQNKRKLFSRPRQKLLLTPCLNKSKSAVNE